MIYALLIYWGNIRLYFWSFIYSNTYLMGTDHSKLPLPSKRCSRLPNSQRRRRVLLGLRRTQGGQLLRENHQARLPEGESEGALAWKDQRPGVRVDGKVVFQKKTNGGMNEENAQQMIFFWTMMRFFIQTHLKMTAYWIIVFASFFERVSRNNFSKKKTQ